jgi:hypothetical protein
MAGGNPYAVTPMLGLARPAESFQRGQQLAHASQKAGAERDARQRMKDGRAAMAAAGADAAMRNTVMRDYPELAGEIRSQITFDNDQTKQNHQDTYRGVLDAADPTTAVTALQNRIQLLDSMGVDSTDTADDLQRLLNGDIDLQTLQEEAEGELLGTDEGLQYLNDRDARANQGETPLMKLQRQRDELREKNPNDPRIKRFDDAIAKQDAIESTGVKQADADLRKTEMDIKGLETDMAALAAGTLDPADAAKLEGNLRAEILQRGKEFEKSEDAWSRMVAADAGPGTAASDMAMIFAYMKVLDPGSTVREGEFATAQNAGGLDDKTKAAWNNLISGERLTPDQRDDFMVQGRKLYTGARKKNDKLRNTYTGLATQYGVDPARVVLGREDVEGQVPPPPVGDQEIPTVAGGAPLAAPGSAPVGGQPKFPPQNAQGWKLGTDNRTGQKVYINPNNMNEAVPAQ